MRLGMSIRRGSRPSWHTMSGLAKSCCVILGASSGVPKAANALQTPGVLPGKAYQRVEVTGRTWTAVDGDFMGTESAPARRRHVSKSRKSSFRRPATFRGTSVRRPADHTYQDICSFIDREWSAGHGPCVSCDRRITRNSTQAAMDPTMELWWDAVAGTH